MKRSRRNSDFTNEMNIALRKASEAEYWLQLLRDGEYLDEKAFNSMRDNCIELKKILTTVVKTAKGQ